MGKRDYLPTIIAITKKLCQIIILATPVIQLLYPGNTALQAALVAANEACAELNSQANQQRQIGD